MLFSFPTGYFGKKDKGSSYIERAYERLTEISADDLKRLEYESREKAIRDHIYLMNYNLKKGLEEGKEEGRKMSVHDSICCSPFPLGISERKIRTAVNLFLL